ncbi:MAG: prepilin-type N-terminal cleavage/methylation domain-containing protein [Deltaproteobacteria bacterium]|nr:prepilin-type N-terminal cleavage/methylation domain-containing protein [Deltaproteobacteria bacterium]MBN2673464.1 prepilin-type N-terminal cleavage/methylation domain-containing protein [Deltaproteobacteria bacterium]
MTRRSVTQGGFTVIEIMVAVLLLSSALVAIFAAQFAAVATTNYARNITQATQLGRCKMNELELLFIEEGFQEGDVAEGGECCEFLEGEMITEFHCEWVVETVTFPDMMDAEIDEGDENGAGSIMDQVTGGAAGLSSMDNSQMDQMADVGMDMLTSLMPMVTDLLEQAIRRVTVKVTWKEGIEEKDFQLVQYVTHPSQGPLKLMQEANTVDDVMNSMSTEESQE